MKVEETPKPGVPASDWLNDVEASLQTAYSALLDPKLAGFSVCQSELESIVGRLEEFRSHSGGATVFTSPDIVPRLWRLRKQITLIRAMIRQGAAFYRGVEQMDSQSVLGYAPGGLERAL